MQHVVCVCLLVTSKSLSTSYKKLHYNSSAFSQNLKGFVAIANQNKYTRKTLDNVAESTARL